MKYFLIAVLFVVGSMAQEPDSGYFSYTELSVLPTLIDTGKACYPDSAYKADVEGAVIVAVIIGKDGSVEKAEVKDCRPKGVFDKVALEAAMKCRFEPILIDGEPVRVSYQIPYVFRKNYYWITRCKK